MNRILSLIVISFFAMNANAYYVVTSDGNVDLGILDSPLILWDSKDDTTYSSWYVDDPLDPSDDAHGEDLETAIVAGYLGDEGTTLLYKSPDSLEPESLPVYYLNSEGDPVLETTYFAYKLETAADYYVIKNASDNAGPGDFDTALFQNNENDDYIFFDTAALELLGINNLSDLTISHFTEFSVPEPATFALLLLGFAGIGASRRIHKSRSGGIQ